METGNHYNYFRDYDPKIGRYVESDPVGLAGGLNTFAYVESNPLALTDALGLMGFGGGARGGAGYWGKGGPQPGRKADACETTCSRALNTCLFLTEMWSPLWTASTGFAGSGLGLLRGVGKWVGAGAGIGAGSAPTPYGIGTEGIARGCEAGYKKCLANCQCG